MTWTRFVDMHSGGDQKLSHKIILIEAPEKEAECVFYNRFNRDPYWVTCSCCGSDYSLDECVTLEQATGFDRGCEWDGNQYVESPDNRYGFRKYQTIEEYLASGDVLVIRASEIKLEEKQC